MGGGGGGAGGSQSIYYEARGGHAGEQIVSIVNVVQPTISRKIELVGVGSIWSNPPTTSVGTVTDQTTIYRKSFDGGSSSFSDITAAGELEAKVFTILEIFNLILNLLIILCHMPRTKWLYMQNYTMDTAVKAHFMEPEGNQNSYNRIISEWRI